jgi:hypothetical protein
VEAADWGSSIFGSLTFESSSGGGLCLWGWGFPTHRKGGSHVGLPKEMTEWITNSRGGCE